VCARIRLLVCIQSVSNGHNLTEGGWQNARLTCSCCCRAVSNGLTRADCPEVLAPVLTVTKPSSPARLLPAPMLFKGKGFPCH
jgi:hypothetical protein